jgi:purine-binding chemotaxis protein CheW
MSGRRQYCTFFLGGLHFGVEVACVQEVVLGQEFTRLPLAPPVVCGLMNLRGQIVTGLDLRRRLDLPECVGEHPNLNVVLRAEDGAVSLLVDEAGEVVEVDPDSCEPPPQTLRGAVRELVDCVVPLEGGLLLVLDVGRTLDLTTQTPA